MTGWGKCDLDNLFVLGLKIVRRSANKKCNIGSVIDCFSVCYRQLKLQSGIPLPKHYRIIFECYESSQSLSEKSVA